VRWCWPSWRSPWHLVAGLRAPGFFWFYFVNEQIRRALGTRYPRDYAAVPARHLVDRPPGVVSFRGACFFPTLYKKYLVPATGAQISTPRTKARLFLFLWASVILLFFTLVNGSRLEYYGFGAWPAIALLIGLGLARR